MLFPLVDGWKRKHSSISERYETDSIAVNINYYIVPRSKFLGIGMSSPYRSTNISTPGDATPRGVVGEDIFSPRYMTYLRHMS
jgi:hypothetical protein